MSKLDSFYNLSILYQNYILQYSFQSGGLGPFNLEMYKKLFAATKNKGFSNILDVFCNLWHW